jgi:hypothetical protein
VHLLTGFLVVITLIGSPRRSYVSQHSCDLVLLVCAFAVGQTNDADKQKLIDIEQQGAAAPSFNSPETRDFLQKYLYDGTTCVIVPLGHLYRTPKAVVVDFAKKPDLADPDVKSIIKLSDFQVETYGDTALVSYKQLTTDSGHKIPVLNGDFTLTCLDTFVKRKTEWYAIGSACVPSAPISQARWDAMHQMEKLTEELRKQQQKPPSQ